MSEELRPCPFCGGEAELCYSEVDTFCRKCNVMQETELWNTRPIEDALNARIAELEALIDQLIAAGESLTRVAEWRYANLTELLEWDTLVEKIHKEREK